MENRYWFKLIDIHFDEVPVPLFFAGDMMMVTSLYRTVSPWTPFQPDRCISSR